MPDVLTQSEIDDLLKAISTGELDVKEVVQDNSGKKVSVYDFKRPNKFAKDQLRTLEMIHENYARLVSTFLSGYLRSFVTVDLVTVEQLTYYEFTNSLSNPTILALCDASPLSGTLIFEVSPSLTYAIIDRILGGYGNGVAKIRNFTEIEETIMRNLLDKAVGFLVEPWRNVIEITPRVTKLETNSQFIQIMSPNEIIALITLRVKVVEAEGMINIAIPHLSIEPIVNKLSTRFWFTSSGNNKEKGDATLLERRIENASVLLRVILGQCDITVEEFCQLQSGDVLRLDSKCDRPLEMYIDNNHIFNVKPGLKKNRIAVKVVDIVRRGDEGHE
jgi:flagellar motor switch protein FliM